MQECKQNDTTKRNSNLLSCEGAKTALLYLSIMKAKKRDYKKEYKEVPVWGKAKKYRAALNRFNRKKGTYGNGDGLDASHSGGRIVGFEAESKNRDGERSLRLKKNK